MSYGNTTCRQWKTQMNKHEQFVAAADMLIAARRVDGYVGLPPDSLIRTFQNAIATACSSSAANSQPVSGVASLVYVLATEPQ